MYVNPELLLNKKFAAWWKSDEGCIWLAKDMKILKT